ncbi:hypothetical protein KM043_000949 [Ampulex compressa]|nr:hypothetical protein KM043_000949 [Ampulex compressa]
MAGAFVGSSVKLGLRAIGAWPGEPRPSSRRYFWAFNLTLVQIFQYRYVLDHLNSGELLPLMEALGSTLTYSLLLLKLILLWAHERKFYELLAVMRADSAREGRATTSGANFARNFSNAIILARCTAVLLFSVGSLVPRTSNGGSDAREFLLKMKLPFEDDRSPVYELLLIAQFLHILSCASVLSVLDGLMVTLVFYVGDRIDVACQRLATIRPGDARRCSSIETLIASHQKIISVSKIVEDIFCYIALMEFLTNSLVLCCLGFVIVIALGAEDAVTTLVEYVLFYVTSNVEVFVMCFAGEYLSIKSKMIGDAAYESRWYSFDARDRRLLLLLTMRSQKCLTITIGKFTDLSLERFTTILKASASYVSVLHAMYRDAR